MEQFQVIVEIVQCQRSNLGNMRPERSVNAGAADTEDAEEVDGDPFDGLGGLAVATFQVVRFQALHFLQEIIVIRCVCIISV